MIMLDTNICIYVMKQRTPELRDKFNLAKDLCISAITHAELCYGIENGAEHLQKQRYHQLQLFTDNLVIEPWDALCSRHYGEIRSYLKRQGNPIGNNDLLIAAHARRLQATLITNNSSEFNRVPQLRVENWV
ncbi:type II toxin-antitoxin system VapC family toxin [Ectothiorhodospiraceae bacterium BW-2]|nr:type II toxin-antitoxin system VapC family toxin [Ectothiorhodospiraceae bacterium BW-2]